MNRLLLLTVFILLFCSSCTKEIQIDWPLLSEKSVVNAFLVADKPIDVFLGRSHSPIESNGYLIDEPQVVVYGNGSCDTLTCVDNGHYSSSWIVMQDSDYAVKVFCDDTLCVSSSDRVPCAVSGYTVSGFADGVGVDDQGDRYSQFEITFKDDPNKANFYEVAIEFCDGYEYEYYWCSSMDISIQSERLSDTPAKYVIFSDKLFNGQEKHLFMRYIPIQYSNGEIISYERIVVHFRNVSKNYFQYKKTLAFSMAEGEADFWQGMADPTLVHSNVDGGYGIFAGYYEKIDTICRILR